MATKKKAKPSVPAVTVIWVPLHRSCACGPGERIEHYDPSDPPQEAIDYHKRVRAEALERAAQRRSA